MLHTGSNIISFSTNPDTYIFKFPTGYTPALAGRVVLALSSSSISVMAFFDNVSLFAREQYQANSHYYGSFCYLI